METFISILLSLVAVYLVMGLVFSLYFSFSGVKKIDGLAKNSSFGFKLIIIPGSILLWPLLVIKLKKP